MVSFPFSLWKLISTLLNKYVIEFEFISLLVSLASLVKHCWRREKANDNNDF
jgi:hypothetical protein